MKGFRILTAALASLLMTIVGMLGAGAVGIGAPLTANEGNATVWIFAVIVIILALGGVAFFFFNNKKK